MTIGKECPSHVPIPIALFDDDGGALLVTCCDQCKQLSTLRGRFLPGKDDVDWEEEPE